MRFFILIFFLFGAFSTTAFSQAMCIPNGNGNINGSNSGYESLTGSGQCAGINCECASLVKNYNPALGAASSWQPGQHVSADSCPPSGTPIATFNDFGRGGLTYGDKNNPGGASGQSHSAILKGCSAAGMIVVEQYNSSGGVIETTIPWGKTGAQGGDKYYAITSPTAPGENGLNGSGPGSGQTPGNAPMCDPATDPSVKPPQPVTDGNMDAASISAKLISILSNMEACWSCNVYESLASGTMGLFEQTYTYFVAENSVKFLLAISSIFALVLVWKLMLIVSLQVGSAPNVYAERWSDVGRYIARVLVVSSLFLFAGVGSYLSQGSNNEFIGARDFVDVPFAVGTSLTCSMLEKSKEAMNLDKAESIGCNPNAKPASWVNEHVDMAKKILFGFHQIGVKGIAFGVYLMTSAVLLTINLMYSSLSFGSTSGLIGMIPQLIVMFAAGVVMTLSFIVFTVSFGMRFIDALLRGFISIALAPIFFFLWVFDKTREMAHSALRSVLFMGAVFVLSALTYSVSSSIINWSFSIVPAATSLASNVGTTNEAIEGAEKALRCASASGVVNLDCVAALGSVNITGTLGNAISDIMSLNPIGTKSSEIISQTMGQQAKVQWVAYFIVMAAFGLATGLVQLAFTVAEGLVAFKGSRKVDTGNMAFNAAESAGEALSQAGQRGANMAYDAPGKLMKSVR